MSKKLVFSLLTFLISFNVQAQLNGGPYVQFGQPITGGTGCPADSASIALDVSSHVGVVLLDHMGNDSRGQKDQLILRAACAARVPASVARGYSLGVRVKSVQGAIAQSRGVSAKVQVDVGFVGSETTSHLEKAWTAAINNRFDLSSDLADSDFIWSKCGGDSMLTMNSSVLAQKAKAKYTHVAALDQIELEFAVKRCQ